MHKYVLDKYGDELPLNYNLECKNTGMKAIMADPELQNLPFHQNQEAQFENFVTKFAEAIRLYRQSLQQNAVNRES